MCARIIEFCTARAELRSVEKLESIGTSVVKASSVSARISVALSVAIKLKNSNPWYPKLTDPKFKRRPGIPKTRRPMPLRARQARQHRLLFRVRFPIHQPLQVRDVLFPGCPEPDVPRILLKLF